MDPIAYPLALSHGRYFNYSSEIGVNLNIKYTEFNNLLKYTREIKGKEKKYLHFTRQHHNSYKLAEQN